MFNQTTVSLTATSSVARSELILGGQRSGKSARSERVAGQWLAQSLTHRAVYVATAQAHDAEMAARIARHQADRAARVPTMVTVEEPVRLAAVLQAHSSAETIVVIDCLTLWLTNLLMPHHTTLSSEENTDFPSVYITYYAMFLEAIKSAQGPVVMVSNEIGLGVIPMGREVRAYVDALGRLNQDVARVCQRVTLMAAGLPLTLKDEG